MSHAARINFGWLLWAAVFVAVFAWSAVAPYDRATWVLEVAPAVAGALILALTRRVFPLTPLAYWLVLAHCIILMVGGHYTYARVPGFEGLPWFGDGTRNNYDKLGHFAQGFVPALLAREILLRKAVVADWRWRSFFIVCICLAFSAFYELIEWWVALLSATAAESFLGTQGYEWDTQSDMAVALLGAIAALALLARWHDRQLATLQAQMH